jgi:hypothetical protein
MSEGVRVASWSAGGDGGPPVCASWRQALAYLDPCLVAEVPPASHQGVASRACPLRALRRQGGPARAAAAQSSCQQCGGASALLSED